MSVRVSEKQQYQVSAAPAYALPVTEKRRVGYFLIKRSFDLLASLLGLILCLVPMLVIAITILIESPGGAIFRQERLGKDGKPYMMYKFRSMRQDAEDDGPVWAEENDPRCTGFGRFLRRTKLDELPQLYNILRGEMSFVGPRPERAYFYDKFETDIPNFRQRLAVKPGLTGLAQIKAGCNVEPEEKIVYDLEYIRRMSVGLDLRCILKTPCTIFSACASRRGTDV